MSSLLEEAIVDAKALKDVALKNAENVVLEKYSTEVKSALSTLLEQDEFGLEEEAPQMDTSFTDDIPFAFQNEELDAPAEDELIEIDFDQLKARIAEEEAQGIEAQPEEMLSAAEIAPEIAPEIAATELGEQVTDKELGDDAGEDEASLAGASARVNLDEDEDEEINLTEEMLSELIEELVVDIKPVPQGWSSINSADNGVEQANNDAMAAAQDAHLEEVEELEEEEETAPDVTHMVYETKIKKLTESTKELYALLMKAKGQLTQLNLENAKLVYQNKALNSTSLNERQKSKIVEAVQSANSVEEANMIF
ncbi:hypothetical protein CMI37_32990, partial [Candidatus Pacearchaeota archaeon]|nr:hypothetical protein [Candidatus Pacearchaeota archaeon]